MEEMEVHCEHTKIFILKKKKKKLNITVRMQITMHLLYT